MVAPLDPMACHPRIAPVRLTQYDERSLVRSSRVVGYRVLCSCGFSSGVRSSVRELRDVLVAHGHGYDPGSGPGVGL